MAPSGGTGRSLAQLRERRMPIYDKPVRVLMHDMVADLHKVKGDAIQRDEVFEWFRAKYPLVKEGTIAAHLLRLSTNAKTRVHYSPREDGSDDLFFQLDSGRFRLYEPGIDPDPIRKGGIITDVGAGGGGVTSDGGEGTSEFAYEHDLRDYLARNLHLLEPGLKLYADDDGVTGVEFPAGGRFIDILAVDRSGGYVVVELKVSRGYDRVVGQLLRYVGWIEQHHAEADQPVRGMIVAKEVTQDLRLACRRVNGVKLFEYSLSVSVRPIETV